MSAGKKPTLYAVEAIPAGRLVALVARIVGVELDVKPIDLYAKEQLKPEFIKINPFHCIPTLVDTDGFTLWESAAIASYLIQSRTPNSELYPANDLKKRLTIDQFLLYNVGTLYRSLTDVHYAAFLGADPAPKVERVKEVLGTVNSFLEGHGGQMVAGGKQMTLADIALYVNLSYIELIKFDITEFGALKKYIAQVKEALAPYNADGWYEQQQKLLISLIENFKAKFAEDQAKAKQ